MDSLPHAPIATPEQRGDNSDRIAPDCHGLNFFELDQSLQGLLELYLPADLLAHMRPHYERLGEISGGRLDALARMSDKRGPQLHARDAFGREVAKVEGAAGAIMRRHLPSVDGDQVVLRTKSAHRHLAALTALPVDRYAGDALQ